MICLVFVGVGLLLAYNLGVIVTEKRYEKIIKEKEQKRECHQCKNRRY